MALNTLPAPKGCFQSQMRIFKVFIADKLLCKLNYYYLTLAFNIKNKNNSRDSHRPSSPESCFLLLINKKV